jgi:predicted outer membrane repeat protein
MAFSWRRHTQRKQKDSRPVLKGWTFRPSLEALELRLTPSTFTVTTTADDGSSGSLRGAINAADAVGGAQTVTLGPGLYKLTQTSTTETSTAGDLDVSCDLTLIGANSATTIIDGGGIDRIFDVEAVLNVSFSNVTLRNGLGNSGDTGGAVNASGGNLSFTNVLLLNNSVSDTGGAIYTTTGNITLTNCSLIGNHAADEGGAISTSKGAVTITNSTLQLNTAGSSGGAINMDGSGPAVTLSITNSSVNNNRAGSDGGAIADSSTGSITISKCVVINNVAGDTGGAIYADASFSSLTIDSSNVGFNSAGSYGGAIYADGDAKLLQVTNSNLSADKAEAAGGVVYTDATSVTFTNDVVVSNVAGTEGGAIYTSSTSTLTVNASTLNNNVAESEGGAIHTGENAVISNSILNFNASGSEGGAVYADASSITVANTIMFQNTAESEGGAIGTDATTGLFTNDQLTNNNAGSEGGGLYFDGTTLTMVNCTVSNNVSGDDGGALISATGGSGVTTITGGNFNGNTASSDGGGMYLEGTASVTNATIHNNVSGSSGGGIFYDSGTSLTVTTSNITNNTSHTYGGGVEDDEGSGTMVLLGDFISGNTATENWGGGVAAFVATGTFTDVSGGTAIGNTVTQNTAGDFGGGLLIEAKTVTFNASLISGNRSGDDGGGVDLFNSSTTATATLTNDTFAANVAAGNGSGGGLFNEAKFNTTLVNDTFNLNVAASGSAIYGDGGTTKLGNTLVADVPQPAGNGTLFGGIGLSSLGHNLSSDKSGTFLTGSGDVTNITNPKLGPLQDNGGPTFTFALLPGSVAIDAGDDSLGGLTPSVDQRGVTRPQDGGSGLGPHVDIGAFEFVQLSKLLVTGPNTGSSPPVQVFNALKLGTPTQLSYSPITVGTFSNGARVALGDVNGDGIPDVLVGSGPGQPATVDIYNGATGALLNTFTVLKNSGGTAFTGGVFVAEGTFGGKPSIVVGADAGGGSRVQVIDANTGTILYDFLAFAPSFTGGVRVGITDLNGDGQDDIICGAGGQVGSSPQVVVLDGTNPSHVLRSLSLFGTNFTGGQYVAGGSFAPGSIYGDIVVGEGNFGSEVKVYGGSSGLQLQDFSAFASTFTGGVRVGTLQDINGDSGNGSEIIVGQGPGGSNEVKVVEGSSPSTVIDDFFAYSTSVTNGVFVGGA